MPNLQTFEGAYLWKYVPQLSLSLAFLFLFTIATIVQCWKSWRAKAWFTIPFLIAGVCEVVGYATRAFCFDKTGSLILYLFQDIFLVLPPIGFAATLYMVYSRAVRAIRGEALSPVPMRWATWIFVGGDWICLMIQGNAAGLLGNSNLTTIADYIIIAGLVLQIMVTIFFIGCCGTFDRRMNIHLRGTGATTDVPWQASFKMLYATSTMVLMRNVYRVVEFVSQAVNQEGYLQTREWPLYVFDASLMWLLMGAFFIWYPSWLPRGTIKYCPGRL
ncbi:RTA1 like protein-domain-containing protein [Penicillium angulare]|uniref:RTA1 like protein-domain-containing protein n=1 Tax=Penicillium angulare TaxID=116970 RepID=A0A9W9F3M9_9EURO|nr:RTA1 like protein-domain-containing protein [Penicillium angulare]